MSLQVEAEPRQPMMKGAAASITLALTSILLVLVAMRANRVSWGDLARRVPDHARDSHTPLDQESGERGRRRP